MTPLLIIGGILAGVLLLGAAPLTISLTYRTDDGIRVKAGVPPIMLSLYPDLETQLDDEDLTLKEKRALLKKLEKKRKKKAKKVAKKEAKKEKKQTTTEKEPEKIPKKKKSAKRNIRFLARFIGILLKRASERATVTIKRCYLTVGTKDAAETAYLYGALSASVVYLLAVLDVYTKHEPSRKHVGVFADFTSDTIQADIAISLHIRLFSALKLALHAIWHYMNRNTKTPSAQVQKG